MSNEITHAPLTTTTYTYTTYRHHLHIHHLPPPLTHSPLTTRTTYTFATYHPHHIHLRLLTYETRHLESDFPTLCSLIISFTAKYLWLLLHKMLIICFNWNKLEKRDIIFNKFLYQMNLHIFIKLVVIGTQI